MNSQMLYQLHVVSLILNHVVHKRGGARHTVLSHRANADALDSRGQRPKGR
jgi:hypothetical protein